jgi:predicted metal-dependent hydrolase
VTGSARGLATAAHETRTVEGLVYEVRRSPRARRLRLTIRDDGAVLVGLPLRAPLRIADEFVASRAAWIGRHRARLAAERERHDARGGIGDGGWLEYAGVPHRLEVRTLPAGRKRSRVEHDEAAEGADPFIRAWLAPADRRTLATILEGWLRREARAAIERRIAARAPQLGVRPVAIAVRDQRSRWGSASRHGRLSFNWRLILAPPAVLDYVVVHELAHLRVLGHTPRFWRLVVDVVPEAEKARRWLREHARELRWILE